MKDQKLPCRWHYLQTKIHQVRLAAFLGVIEINKCSDDTIATIPHLLVAVDCVMLIRVVVVVVEFTDLCLTTAMLGSASLSSNERQISDMSGGTDKT